MKKLVALLLVSMMATVAFAGLDPDADSFGVYFDVNGMSNCASVGPFVPTNVYLLLMNPAGVTDGFECTVTPSGTPPYFILSTTLPANTLDVDSSANGFACGAASPFVANPGGAMVLCTWSWMLQAAGTLEFRITQATQPSISGGVPAVTGGGVLRRCGVSSGSVTLPVATMNGGCPVGEEVNSFGSVKSLFR